MSDIRNCSIDFFRYFAAILIASLHITPFTELPPMVGYLLAQVLPRVAVPFFFVISGYYFTKKLEKHQLNLIRYLSSILLPYCLWSGVYFLLDLIQNGTPCLHILLSRFFLFGTAYHLWYPPSLIFVCCTIWILYRLHLTGILLPFGLFLAFWGCAGHAYYQIGRRIPFLSGAFQWTLWPWITNYFILGFTFFLCGRFLVKAENRWKSWSLHRINFTLLASAFFFLSEIVILKLTDFSATVTVTPGLYGIVCAIVIFLLRHPMASFQSAANRCSTLAGFTYYSHILILSLIMWINHRLFGDFFSTTWIFFAVLLSAGCGCIVWTSLKKRCGTVWKNSL